MSDRDDVQANVQDAGQGGGQPRAQPQGQGSAAQAPAGQPPVAQESVVDKLRDPLVRNFAKGIGALYALVGVGIGLFVVAFGWFGNPLVVRGFKAEAAAEVPAFGAYFAQQAVNATARTAVRLLPLLAVVGAVLVGLYAARSVSADEQTTFVAAGVGSLVGSLTMVVSGGYIAGSQMSSLTGLAEDVNQAVSNMDNPPEAVRRAQSFVYSTDAEFQIQTMDLLVTGVGVGVVAALVAVATAYTYRNFLVESL